VCGCGQTLELASGAPLQAKPTPTIARQRTRANTGTPKPKPRRVASDGKRTPAEQRNIDAGRPPFAGAIWFGRRFGYGRKYSAAERAELTAALEARQREIRAANGYRGICARATAELAAERKAARELERKAKAKRERELAQAA
jgi:hypothetical protein